MSLLEDLLDKSTERIIEEEPEKSEFEAAFMAIRANLTALTQMLTQVGSLGEGLNDATLFAVCAGLIETCEWMAGKELQLT